MICYSAILCLLYKEILLLLLITALYLYSASSREDDRVILVALQTEGASRETFSALSEKLSKPSEQVRSSLLFIL